MDLQTNGGKPVTSGNVSPPDNFRAYSPQIADDRRRQPDTEASTSRSETAHVNSRTCLTSPAAGSTTTHGSPRPAAAGI